MGGISGIYILDLKGRLIICRNYKADLLTNVCDAFYENVILQDSSTLKPVFHSDGCTFSWVSQNGIYFIAVASSNYNVSLSISFLYRFVGVLTSYFKHLNEESIRDNFAIVYELLDEMIDNGFPQVTEVSVLREFIKNQYHQLTLDKVRPPTTMTNSVSWRREGIKHKKNELFLDVIESLDLILSASGTVLRSEIKGCLKMKSYLSNMPEVFLCLNDKLLFSADSNTMGSDTNGNSVKSFVELEDVKFHQCVELTKFNSDRTITFIPPDGEFELMTYRLRCRVKPLFSLYVTYNSKSSTRIEFYVKATSQFKSKSMATNVEFLIPVPSDVNCPEFNPTQGSVKYLPDQDAITWYVKQFQGDKVYTMFASFGLPSVSDESRNTFSKNPVKIKFEIPYYTVSGINVKHLRITDKTGYKALPWVRYITKNGDYQLRMA
ncbi:AP-1 complex subunit mu-1 [Theileria parva strain Muguga]|uniref:AP-1 complex subunit mu-1 n=1 Tax=Theileria parva strain Muguga TaxID=333668 RepID=UPI001C61ECFA|nr:AP-1 complex subunit mu-1 [Theileria parva strain Muguga]EAN33950.2 AP-1 complex subunit mu-1 [Theileria parva strain Muguga]